MGNIRTTQEEVLVLAGTTSSARVTQEEVLVLAGPPSESGPSVTQEEVIVLAGATSSSITSQEGILVLANPLGTITTTQEAISVLGSVTAPIRVSQGALNVLATSDANIHVTQEYVTILADFESTIVIPEDPNDGGGGSNDGDDEDVTGGEVYGTPVCATPVALSTTLTTISTLTFTPLYKDKFVIMGQCASAVTYSSGVDAVQTVLGQAVLLVDGTTVAETDIGSLHTYYCLDTTVGVTTTVTIKAKTLQLDATDSSYCARIAAIGLNEWYRVEQGYEQELVGTTTQTKTTLMEDILEPTFGQCMVLSYVEYNPDETNDTTRGSYTVKLDSPSLKDTTLIDMVLSKRSSYQEDFGFADQLSDRWSCLSYAGYLDLPGSRTTIKHIAGKFDSGSNAIKFRRLRTVIIPISENPFGTVSIYGDSGGTQFLGNSTESLTVTPPPRTVEGFGYLVLAHAKTHADQGNGPHQATFRYGGLGMSGTTTNLVALTGLYGGAATTTELAGITFGLRNCDIMGLKTYNYSEDGIIYPGFNGEQAFGFAYAGATLTNTDGYWFFSTSQYQYGVENRFRTGDRMLSVVQFKNQAATLTENLKNSVVNEHNKRTLVELNLIDSVLRYCMQEDVYLLDGFTTTQILNKIAAGTIDRASAEDLTVTGYEVVAALDAGLTTVAENYLNLTTTVIEGATTSTASEYTTESSIYKLYKKGVVSDIQVNDKLPDSLYGVVEIDSIEVSLHDTDEELLPVIDDLQGATVKVRSYDVTTGELKTIGYGSINSVSVSTGRRFKLECGNPDTRVLDAKYPRLKVSDLVRVESVVGETSRLADDNNALVPVFFGDARRMVAPNIDKYYGTTSTEPADYLDAYSDYVIGGPLADNIGTGEDTGFNYVLLEQSYVTTGMYREWVAITNAGEFNSDTIYEFDKFTYRDTNIPTFRFASFLITTPTRSTPLGLPHGATSAGNYDDIETYYPTLCPVTSVLHVYNYVKGLDWAYDGPGANSNKIGWSFSGVANQPEVSTLQTANIIVTRGSERGGKDYLLSSNGATSSMYANIYDIVTVEQDIYLPGSTTIVNNRSYSSSYWAPQSSNELRAFQDIIDWSPTRGYKGLWKFEGNLDNGVTTSYSLIGTEGQPYYIGTDCIEFINSETLGTCYLPGISSADLSTKLQWILYAEVSANIDGELVGTVVAKNNFTTASYSDWKGYILHVYTEDSIYGNGVTTRVIPLFEAAYGTGVTLFTSIAGLTSSTYNLADGEVHSIMIVNTKFDSSNGATYLYVDNVLENYDIDNFYQGNIGDTVNDFIIGGQADSADFEGRIHEIYIDQSARSEPLPGTTYSVEIQYKPDTYLAEWEYLVYSASNPIQLLNTDTPYTIAGDFKVNGSDLTPDTTYAGITGTDVSYSWLKYAHKHGYAVQLNRPEYGGTNGHIEIFHEDISDVSFTRDFCVYAACKWTGTPASADLIVKNGTGAEPTYFVGVTNGYVYGKITGRGDTVTLTSDVFIADEQVHFVMLEREGYDMSIYVDERKVATTRVKRSTASDYDNAENILVGSGQVTGNNWIGDILFVGACNFAPGAGYAAYQTNLLNRGIKGSWVSMNEDSQYTTIFHIPFIEGEGLQAYSRNLAKNAAYNVKRLLSDPIFGMGEAVDSSSFDDAAEILDDAGLKMDFVTRGERTFADVLKDMCILRGMQLKKDAGGRWTIKVDSERDQIRGRFGLHDGFYNNIISVDTYEIKDVDSQVKTVNLRYRYMPDITGELKYHVSISRNVSPNGIDILDIESPYIMDHETADKCIDYLSKRLRYSNKSLKIKIGQEGRNLEIGDIIMVAVPELGIDNETYKISEIGYNISVVELTMEEYSTEIFNYTPGTFPLTESIPTGDDRVGLI